MRKLLRDGWEHARAARDFRLAGAAILRRLGNGRPRLIIMAFNLTPKVEDADADAPSAATDQIAFQVSPDPVIAPGEGSAASAPSAADDLPASYGSQTLYLLPRDPRTLFAYWDVDWERAFAGEPPRDRQVHLRVRASDEGGEEQSLVVEPMAGSCYVEVADGNAAYTGEIGYFQPAGRWHSVARATAIKTPPDAATDAGPDFTTVPFHLSFQRMTELFRSSKHEGESLTAILQELRERAGATEQQDSFTEGERDLVDALRKSAAPAPAAPSPSKATGSDLWARLSRFRSGGLGGSSPGGETRGGDSSR